MPAGRKKKEVKDSVRISFYIDSSLYDRLGIMYRKEKGGGRVSTFSRYIEYILGRYVNENTVRGIKVRDDVEF